MPARILSGEPVAEAILAEVKSGVARMGERGITLSMAAILIGEPAGGAKGYIKAQKAAAFACGIEHEVVQIPDGAGLTAIKERIGELNASEEVHGIIVLTPLPQGVDPRALRSFLSPSKDVEGMHPANLGSLFHGGGGIGPCTAVAAVELLKTAVDDLAGKEVVVVGHSEIVGKPVALMLLQSPDRAPTVTVCHVATDRAGRLADHTRRADVVISAVGVRPGLITADMLADGSVVIDVATIETTWLGPDGRPALDKKGRPARTWVGDVDFEGACARCAAVTPVPGGVGPVTTAVLMRNVLRCAEASL